MTMIENVVRERLSRCLFVYTCLHTSYELFPDNKGTILELLNEIVRFVKLFKVSY